MSLFAVGRQEVCYEDTRLASEKCELVVLIVRFIQSQSVHSVATSKMRIDLESFLSQFLEYRLVTVVNQVKGHPPSGILTDPLRTRRE